MIPLNSIFFLSNLLIQFSNTYYINSPYYSPFYNLLKLTVFTLKNDEGSTPGSRIFIFSLLLLVSIVAVSGASIFTGVYVLMKNDLGNGIDLQVHCKSKDNDLGVHHLAYQAEYGFSFHPSVFGITLFFCGMEWDGKLHWFDIYDYSRDGKLCSNCTWSIQKDRPCRFNEKTQKSDICYPWNPNLAKYNLY